MSDNELIRIATHDAKGLTDQATAILKSEINKRGIGKELIEGAEAQNKEYTLEELLPYCNLISALNCPICGKSLEKLNATVTAQTISILIITNYEKRPRIGCPKCLKNKNISAAITTLVLGWWGIPWGQ